MSEFVSSVKVIPHNDECIFAMLSDLSNLERIRERIPQDKIKDFTFDRDSCHVCIEPVGSIRLRIVEREPNRTIKFASTQSPVPFFLWIQLKQVAGNDTRMKLTVRAELNAFVQSMVSRPLQEGMEKMADILANLPYAPETLGKEHEG
jgi:carbon monoxide dehydrogenase subunit G